MTTECNQFVFGFHPQKRREIRAQFDGGAITSDGGGLLLREVEKRVGILHQFATCFTDYRNPDLIDHQLVAQRVYGLALGYEDLNDHDELRNDPLLAVLVEKEDPGKEALAGKSTLNRLELTKPSKGGHCQGDGGSESPVPRDGACRPVIQRVRLPVALMPSCERLRLVRH